MRNKTLLVGAIGIVTGVLLSTAVVFAGSLTPGSGPGDASSQMYTLQQIYQRLTTGQYLTKQSAFTEPASGPGAGTMRTLDEIMAVAQPRALAKRVAKTGQTTCYDSGGGTIACAGTGQDGQYQRGIDPVVAPTCCGTTNAYNTPAWTGVRFTDNGDGTVTDNLTALIWLKNANCFFLQGWANALSAANTLRSGECGLTDVSVEGDWRLPNVNELHSLGPTWPPGAPFSDMQSDSYWSSTSGAAPFTAYAYVVDLDDGSVAYGAKTFGYYVWPVRGGQ
jgi:hypothetical protein